MSKLTLDKEQFVECFLTPISKIAENVSLVPFEKGIYAICSTQIGGSVILYAEYKSENLFSLTHQINIPDIKKFIRLLSCVKKDTFDIDVKGNHLLYADSDIKFKYFLLEDSVMQRVTVSCQKIKSLAYNTTFNLPIIKFNELLKGSSITTDSDKLYLFTREGNIHAELNDFERQNINSVDYFVTDAFEGCDLQTPIPLSLESVRLLAGLKATQFTVRINTQLKIVTFEAASGESVKTQFIISGLVK
jgi:hypothetical protein